MSKLLSICIPSYNMEQYLSRCVDSMLVDEVLDQLEIIIVNDGSKDGTLAIANDYKQRYPQSLVVIDKPNGHYGSCINASLKVATGKYFRIVDADDWVDSKALAQLVTKLNDLDVDCVCTKYATRCDDKIDVQPLVAPFNIVLDLNQFKLPIECFHMHCLTYKTDLLRKIDYKQTEGVCYTDLEYVYTPLSCARDFYALDLCLYQYLVGRDGQSVAIDVLVKNNDHYLKVIRSIDETAHSNLPFNENEPKVRSIVLSNLVEIASIVYISNYDYDLDKERTLRKIMKELFRSNSFVFTDMWSENRKRMIKLWYYSGSKLSRIILKPLKKHLKL